MTTKDKFIRLDNQLDDLIVTKALIDRIIKYKEKLESIAEDKLSNEQKIWLRRTERKSGRNKLLQSSRN